MLNNTSAQRSRGFLGGTIFSSPFLFFFFSGFSAIPGRLGLGGALYNML
jgi:hypothetical protein